MLDAFGQCLGRNQRLRHHQYLTEEAIVLGADGKIGQQMMPVSASAGDLNKDVLDDIAIMDGQGFLRVHFDTGTKQEPKLVIGNPFLRPHGERGRISIVR